MEEKNRFLAGRKKAMALLSSHDRTKWELCDRMEKAGFGQEEIEDAVAYVESFHYIDDLHYAVHFANLYRETRSMQRIRQDLLKRHVPEEYIEMALEQVGWDDSPALCKEVGKLLQKRVPEELSYQEKQKIMAKLYRKGFRTDAIIHAIDNYKNLRIFSN